MKAILSLILLALLAGAASAQTSQKVGVCDTTLYTARCASVGASGDLYVNQYPGASTPITGNAAGSTGAVVGSLAAAAGKTTYICGFDVSATGGTATVGPVTVAGIIGSSMVYQFFSTASGANFTKTFGPCIPASAVNTAITITTTADGTASAVDVNSWGFQQ